MPYFLAPLACISSPFDSSAHRSHISIDSRTIVSASHCPLTASHLCSLPHSSKHFYFLSHLFRQFLSLSLFSYNSFILYRYSPSFSPPLLHAYAPKTCGINLLSDARTFRQFSSILRQFPSFTLLCLSPVSTSASLPSAASPCTRLQPHARMLFLYV